MTNPTGLPYTPAVAAGDWVVVSGQLGLLDGTLVTDSFGAEVAQLLVNLEARLTEQGLTLGHVVKTTCFLADLDDFAEFNDLYGAAFPEPRPARSAFEVSRLPLGARVEVEAWAFRGERG